MQNHPSTDAPITNGHPPMRLLQTVTLRCAYYKRSPTDAPLNRRLYKQPYEMQRTGPLVTEAASIPLNPKKMKKLILSVASLLIVLMLISPATSTLQA
jgi:hypothetical protein